MDEAIELAIAEESPYPEVAWFIDANTPYTQRYLKQAESEGMAVVLVSGDGSTRTVLPETRSPGSPQAPTILRHP